MRNYIAAKLLISTIGVWDYSRDPHEFNFSFFQYFFADTEKECNALLASYLDSFASQAPFSVYVVAENDVRDVWMTLDEDKLLRICNLLTKLSAPNSTPPDPLDLLNFLNLGGDDIFVDESPRGAN